MDTMSAHSTPLVTSADGAVTSSWPDYVITGDEPLPLTARHHIEYLRHNIVQQQQQTQVGRCGCAAQVCSATPPTAARWR